jgi:hypothetical protein
LSVVLNKKLRPKNSNSPRQVQASWETAETIVGLESAKNKHTKINN